MFDLTEADLAVDVKLKTDLITLSDKSYLFEIRSVTDATQALSMALQARKISSAIIESKKEVIRPHLDYQKAVNKIVADYIQKLGEIESNLTKKLEKWIETDTEQAYSSGLDGIQVIDGSLKRVSTWCFDVDNSIDIPFEYMCPDIEAIERAIKAGIRNIPGITIYPKMEIKLRVKN